MGENYSYRLGVIMNLSGLTKAIKPTSVVMGSSYIFLDEAEIISSHLINRSPCHIVPGSIMLLLFNVFLAFN